jgi:hypothetical protein
LFGRAPRGSPGGCAPLLERRAVVEVAAGEVPLARRPSTVPSNTISPPPVPRRAEVDDVVGDGDRLGLVLDDEHGVALVAQLQQQVVHALDVVGCSPIVGSSNT